MTFSGAFTQRYAIERSLGAGAMGEVFLAKDVGRGGPVAIKTVLASMFADEDARLRFLREARITSALSHPNIIRVIDQGQDEGRLFIVLEYVEGGGLGALLREKGPLSPELFFTIAVALLDAMVYAHRKGVLHRDLKADNVLLDREMQPRIADFGLAKGLDNAGLETVTGTLMGTPTYMAPELAKGLTASEATDQYALGVLLYHMLTAKAPFTASNPLDLLQKHIEEAPPPVTVHRPEVPRALALAVQRALAKPSTLRWPDLAALRDAVNSLVPTAREGWSARPGENPWDMPELKEALVKDPGPVQAPALPPRPEISLPPVPPAPAVSAPPPPSPATIKAAAPPKSKTLLHAIIAVLLLNVILLSMKKKPPEPAPPPATPSPTVAAPVPLAQVCARLEKAPDGEVPGLLEQAARGFAIATWKERARAVRGAHAIAARTASVPALRFLAGLGPGPLTGVKDLRFLGPTGKADVDFPPALDGAEDFRRETWCTRPIASLADDAGAKAILEKGARAPMGAAKPLVRLVLELKKPTAATHVDVAFGTEVVVCHRVPPGMSSGPKDELEVLVFSTLLDAEAAAAGMIVPPDPALGRVGLAYADPAR